MMIQESTLTYLSDM